MSRMTSELTLETLGRRVDELASDVARLKTQVKASPLPKPRPTATPPDYEHIVARQIASGLIMEPSAEWLAWVDELNAVIGNPVIRYPIAVALVGLAVKLVHDSIVGALPVIVALGLAIWAAHELAKWLILFGLLLSAGYLLFHGVAALPVIAAVILVAMIIASAGNK